MSPIEVVTPLTSKQRDRRDRVVDAAMALAIEGGYDAVHMREVSARTGVALGTIYRYFPSKDHLLISVMSSWTDQLSTQLDQRPARGSTPASRVTDVLHRACHSLERQPLLAAAVIRAMSSTEVGVSRASREVGRNLRGNIEPLLAEFDTDTRDAIIEIINHVWLSTLIAWSSGRILFSQVSQQLAMTVRMLLDADVRLPGRAGPAAATGTGRH
ncbi:MAG: Transcriptional regulator, TetR family [Ilumatobacteraceae bacterium]|nr:Transcriptional regulator, TetR family [Ilumatobacteraceae bacterium]